MRVMTSRKEEEEEEKKSEIFLFRNWTERSMESTATWRQVDEKGKKNVKEEPAVRSRCSSHQPGRLAHTHTHTARGTDLRLSQVSPHRLSGAKGGRYRYLENAT